MAGKFDMGDYVDVAERIALFREKHPEGSLGSEILRYPEDGFPFVVVRAAAFRYADDPTPGIGHAAEPYPGKTPYTKDSEVMVAETSAWGRAIVAALAADTKRGVASKDEVRARKAAGAGVSPLSPPAPAPSSPAPQGVAGGDAGTGGKGDREAPASGPCTHTNTSPLLPSGKTVAAGRTFCLDCRTVVKEAS